MQVEVAIKSGDLHAVRALAKQYSQGVGVRKNRRLALRLYQAGASLGDAELAWYAADALEHGLGAPKSPTDAAQFLTLAAELGSVGATTALGEYKWHQAKSDADRREAIALYRRAAKHGEPHALHNLGVCYSSGNGLRKNTKLAFEKFVLAAEQGHVEAAFKVGWCLLHGEGIAANRRLARQWLRRAAGAGHSYAARLLDRDA